MPQFLEGIFFSFFKGAHLVSTFNTNFASTIVVLPFPHALQ
jgi:hypothetical protein